MPNRGAPYGEDGGSAEIHARLGKRGSGAGCRQSHGRLASGPCQSSLLNKLATLWGFQTRGAVGTVRVPHDAYLIGCPASLGLFRSVHGDPTYSFRFSARRLPRGTLPDA